MTHSVIFMQSVSLYQFDLPMQTSFSHALHTHRHSQGLLLRVDFDGFYGWGEAAPRRYVTGESVESVIEDVQKLDFESLARDLLHCDFEEGLILIKNLECYLLDQQSMGPSARCLVELALLDALLKHAEMSFIDLYHQLRDLPLQTFQQDIDYTWVSDLDSANALVSLLSQPGHQTPKRLKIKVNQDLDKMQELLTKVRVINPDITLSLDVNEGWDTATLMRAGEILKPYRVAFIEEPTQARSWDIMAQFRKTFGIPIMLDESFSLEADIYQGNEQQAFDLLNIRISKCGGFLAAIKYLQLAESLDKGVYFGVHVGEVGPLFASQRALASCVENSYGVEVGKQDQWFAEKTIQQDYGVDRSTHRAQGFDGFGHGVEPSAYLMSHTRSIYQLKTL